MQTSLTTDQYRILRHARDGTGALASPARPRSYVVDVEQLVQQNLVTSHAAGLRLTALGATQLAPMPTPRPKPVRRD